MPGARSPWRLHFIRWRLIHVGPQRGTCFISPFWSPEILGGSQIFGGRDSSVGIATRYGLDGPGIESWWGRDFPHPSRAALGPTQLPVQWVPDLSRG